MNTAPVWMPRVELLESCVSGTTEPSEESQIAMQRVRRVMKERSKYSGAIRARMRKVVYAYNSRFRAAAGRSPKIAEVEDAAAAAAAAGEEEEGGSGGEGAASEGSAEAGGGGGGASDDGGDDSGIDGVVVQQLLS